MWCYFAEAHHDSTTSFVSRHRLHCLSNAVLQLFGPPIGTPHLVVSWWRRNLDPSIRKGRSTRPPYDVNPRVVLADVAPQQPASPRSDNRWLPAPEGGRSPAISWRTAVGVLIAAGVLAGCGGSGDTSSASSSPSGAGVSTTPSSSSKPGSNHRPVALAADPSGRLRYIPALLRARTGTVTIVFTNQSLLLHNLTLASEGRRVLRATPTFMGGSRTLTVKLKPGRYAFYCTVPGHRAAGMHGTLLVG